MSTVKSIEEATKPNLKKTLKGNQTQVLNEITAVLGEHGQFKGEWDRSKRL